MTLSMETVLMGCAELWSTCRIDNTWRICGKCGICCYKRKEKCKLNKLLVKILLANTFSTQTYILIYIYICITHQRNLLLSFYIHNYIDTQNRKTSAFYCNASLKDTL